jgi:hypothetical protein
VGRTAVIGRRFVGVFARVVLVVIALAAPGFVASSSASALGGSTQSATIIFNVCPKSCDGVRVVVAPATKYFRTDTSKFTECTSDESSLDFSPSFNGETRRVQAYFKASGSCFTSKAHNTWLVRVTRKLQPGYERRGFLEITEPDPFLARYSVSCSPGFTPWQPSWDKGLACTQPGQLAAELTIPAAQPAWPDCPATSTMCAINVRFESHAGIPPEPPKTCGGLGSSFELCTGTSTGNKGWVQPVYNRQNGIGAQFSWKASGDARVVEYAAMNHLVLQQAGIKGSVPSPGSAAFSVTDAWTKASSDHWKTGDAAPPGAPGGPLYLDFESQPLSNVITFHGFLERKTSPSSTRH